MLIFPLLATNFCSHIDCPPGTSSASQSCPVNCYTSQRYVCRGAAGGLRSLAHHSKSQQYKKQKMGEEKDVCNYMFFQKLMLMLMFSFIASIIPEINDDCIVRLSCRW